MPENSTWTDAPGVLALPRAPSLTGRVAIVTGGAGGIGAAVATRLATLGASVVVNDLGADPSGAGFNAEAANGTAERIQASGGRAVAYHSSVADADACEVLVRTVLDKLGRLDILVNAAGNIRRGTLEECRQDDWTSVLGVHLGGHINMVRPALEVMRAGGGGQIVNVTSASGLLHMPAQSVAYATAKRAVAALTWHLGRQAASGISVKAVAPVANTRMTSPAAQKMVEEANSKMAGPGDVAPLFSALSCPESSEFYGAVLFTNGAEISQIQPPRCSEFVRAGAPPGAVWKACDQVARKSGDLPGSFLPRFFGSNGDLTPPTSGLTVVILAEEPLCRQLPGLFKAAGMAATVLPLARAATFDEAQLRLKASLDGRSPTDIFVIATCAAAPEPEVSGSTAILERLGGHVSWTRAAQRVTQDQRNASSIWNVTASHRRASGGHEIMRDALSAFASIASVDRSVKFRGYSASLMDLSLASVEALVSACLQFHVRDAANRLSGHAVVISDGGCGCWSKPEVAGTVSSPIEWSEQSVLSSLRLLLG